MQRVRCSFCNSKLAHALLAWQSRCKILWEFSPSERTPFNFCQMAFQARFEFILKRPDRILRPSDSALHDSPIKNSSNEQTKATTYFRSFQLWNEIFRRNKISQAEEIGCEAEVWQSFCTFAISVNYFFRFFCSNGKARNIHRAPLSQMIEERFSFSTFLEFDYWGLC